MVVEADLRPNEIQELADQIGELTRLAAAGDTQLAFHLRVTLNGSQRPSSENMARLDAVLQRVSGNLKLSR